MSAPATALLLTQLGEALGCAKTPSSKKRRTFPTAYYHRLTADDVGGDRSPLPGFFRADQTTLDAERDRWAPIIQAQIWRYQTRFGRAFREQMRSKRS